MTDRKQYLPNFIKPSRPFIYLGLVYLTGLFFFGIFRGLFAFTYREKLVDVPVSEILHAFAIGIRFDTVIVLYILLPLILLLPWLSLKNKAVRIGVISYLTVLFSASFLLLLADIHYYRVSEAHLNFLALDYIEDGRTAWELIIREPGFYLSIIGWGVVATIFCFVTIRWLRATNSSPQRRSWVGQFVWWALILLITFIGARGRLALSPLRWGVAYISNNHTVNQIGLNGIWSLAQTFEAEEGDPRPVYLAEEDRFPFVPFEQALRETQQLLVQTNDRLLRPDSSLKRVTHQPANSFGFKPNIVLILMESFSGRMVGCLGSDLGLTPRFDSLAAHGILFDKFYSGGERTSYGMAATLASSPALPGRSVQKRYGVLHPFRTISEILHDRGYFNLLAYGGDKVFDNIDGFYKAKQYDQIWGDDDFGQELVFAKWGIPDHVLFDRLLTMADGLPRPFNLTVLTLSNHEPFDLPDSSLQKFPSDDIESKVKNAFYYADWSLGRFVDNMKATPLFDSTIFLFVADHPKYDWEKFNLDPENFHCPFLIYTPALIGDSGRVNSTVGGQVDIIPTLMSLLGSDYDHESWGRNLFEVDSTDTGFAMIKVADRVGWIQDGYLYAEPFGRAPALYSLEEMRDSIVDRSNERPDLFKLMQSRIRQYVQLADQLATPGRGLTPPGRKR